MPVVLNSINFEHSKVTSGSVARTIPWHMTPAILNAKKQRPMPLVNENAGYGIVWSAKSACTTILMWHLSHLKMLDAALYYDPWPHTFRVQVLEKSRGYMNWSKVGNPRKLTWYWIVRDPIKRALSGFRHNLRVGYSDKRISELLGRRVTCAEGYSLNDFMDYLEATNVNSPCDVHIRSQWHPLLGRCKFEIVNADRVDLNAALNTIEERHQLTVTNFNSFDELNTMAGRHHNKIVPISIPADGSTILNKNVANGAWPLNLDTLDEPSMSRLGSIYARDMERIYGI